MNQLILTPRPCVVLNPGVPGATSYDMTAYSSGGLGRPDCRRRDPCPSDSLPALVVDIEIDTDIDIDIDIDIDRYVYVYIYMYLFWMYIYICICMFWICIYIYIHICVCIHMHIYIYICGRPAPAETSVTLVICDENMLKKEVQCAEDISPQCFVRF